MKVKHSVTDEKSPDLPHTGECHGGMETGRATRVSAPTIHIRKRKLGMTDMPAARRLKELKKRNRELKEMLAGSLLKQRVLKIVKAKKP